MRRTTALLLVLLVVSSLLLVRNVFGNTISTVASPVYVTTPVVAYDPSGAAYGSSTPESSPVPIFSRPSTPTPTSKLTSGAVYNNVTSTAYDSTAPEPATEPASESLNEAYDSTAPEPATEPASESLNEAYDSTSPEPATEPASESLDKAYDTPAPPTTPTLVVAANDSPQPEGADFICDGTDDQVEIQAAIDALAARGGGMLELLKGTYRISEEGDYSLYLSNNITIKGEDGADKEDVLLVMDYRHGEPRRGVFQTRGWSWNLPWVSVDNITFKNLTIDVGSPAGFLREYPEGVFWHDFLVITATSDHFLLDNVGFIQKNPESVVGRLFFHQSDNVIIQDCEFEGTSVYCFSNGGMLGQPKIMLNKGVFLLQRNIMRNTPTGICPAICGDMNNFTALDNIFYNTRNTAIDIGISTNALVADNEIYGAKLCGIYSEGGHDIIIRNNYIENVGYNNPSNPWDGYGIWTADSRHYRYGGNVLIEGNTIRDCGRGIASNGTPGLTIQNNDIEGMDAYGIVLSFKAEDTYYDGIPSFADDSEVVNNRIIDFGKNYRWSRGIILHNVNGIEVTGNLIDGRGNPGAIEGIGEYHSQFYVCPDCGWIFGPDWSDPTREERTCPECGADLEPWEAQQRPDLNVIRNNTVTAVGTPVTVTGPGTTVDGTEVE